MKYVLKVLVIVFIVGCFVNTSAPTSYGWDRNDELTMANSYIENTFGYVGYYTDYTVLDTKRYDLNPQILTNGHLAFHNKPLFLFGNAKESTDEYFAGKDSGSPAGKYSERNKEFRTLGFTYEGCPFPNPWFPNDYYVVNGKEVTNNYDGFPVEKTPIDLSMSYKDDPGRYWIKHPYMINSTEKEVRELSRAMPDGTINKTIESGVAKMINSWVRTITFQPERMLNDKKLLSKMVVNPPRSVRNNFEDYLAVLSPPTDNSWGVGIAFYYKYVNGVLHCRYSLFYLRPKNMLKNDLSAEFEYDSHEPSRKVNADDKVKFGISIDSTSNQALTGVGYKLAIKDDKGNSIPYTLEMPKDIVISGDKMNLPASWTKFNVNFTMPDSPVNIAFSINPDGKNPDEDILSNNKINTRFLPNVVLPFDFDYNILSKSVKFPLENFNISAQLKLPQGSWNGNATGLLSVTNQTSDLLRGYIVKNNLPVNEASELIVRNPEIWTTFYRKDFGDDPQNNKWLPGPQSITKHGYINYKGSVSRPYIYTYTDGCITNLDGTKSCPGHTDDDKSATDDFNSGTKECTVEAHVYNGKATIKPIDYKNTIEYSPDKINDKKMLWTSEPYEFNVFRMMYDKDVDNKLKYDKKVPGQYKRTFINQNKANTRWEVKSSLKKDYSISRNAAKNRNTNKSLLQKAVFASDRKFRDIDYPIKSGYYFNPTGTYTFTITTYTYKPTNNSTKDHSDIVEAFINAFRYESNLVYKNKSGKAVDLQNNSAKRGAKGYSLGHPAVLSFADHIGLDGKEWLEKTINYTKADPPERIEYPTKVEERNPNLLSVNTTINTVDGLDERWRTILEGYTDSETSSSFKNYRYREYVSSGQSMYRIEETSTVTIKVNPNDTKAYTHDAMADGNYKVKAYIDDILFKDYIGGLIPTMKGNANLDDIDIKVVGSKSDDINVN